MEEATKEKTTWGGARVGAGRKKLGRFQWNIRVNEEEKEYVLKCLTAFRKMKEAEKI